MNIRTVKYIVVSILIILISLIFFLGKYIDETALYYFFSTVAQTMAALVGVLGAFSVFRMQQLDHELINLTGIFVSFLQSSMQGTNSRICSSLYNSLLDDLRNKNYQEIIDKSHKAFAEMQNNAGNDLMKSLVAIQNKHNYKDSIGIDLLAATISGLSLIFSCIVFVLFAKSLTFIFYLKFSILLLSLALVAITLLFFYILIRGLIQER